MTIPEKILHVVHCIDTEGPLNETLTATFERLQSIFGISLHPTVENLKLLQSKSIELGGKEEAVAACFSPALLRYNSNWSDIENMLEEILSACYRRQLVDDFDNGWVFSWHCMDHMGYAENPRHKDVGYGNIFRFYRSKLKEFGSMQDEINWHFHPLSLTKNPINAATSYLNSYEVLTQIICRRILEDNWFPVVNRPGFHSERPDSHSFLEQWIPFDYANQFCEEAQDQPDFSLGRFGDWSRASKSWRGYHPSHDDYQQEGNCRRIIFRCLNVGTRIRALQQKHINEAFLEARNSGSAILSFANHDYRDMRPDIELVRSMLSASRKEFSDVKIKFSGAEAAAKSILGFDSCAPLKLGIKLLENRLIVEVIEGAIFGPQPYLAMKSREGRFYHDNFDVLEPNRVWTYVLDSQTIDVGSISKIGAAAAGRYGGSFIAVLNL